MQPITTELSRDQSRDGWCYFRIKGRDAIATTGGSELSCGFGGVEIANNFVGGAVGGNECACG